MALNITFQGNMFDKDGIALTEVIAKGFHKESNSWTTVDYDFGVESQYNMNLGDSQWLGQDGTVNSGDTVLLVLETKELDPLDRQFVMYEIVLTTDSTYIQDVQLRDCQSPVITGLWSLSSGIDGTDTFANVADSNIITSIGRINDLVTTITNFNDDSSWVYETATLYQVESWLGEDIFSDRLSIDLIEFDWTENDAFVTTDTHTYTLISQSAFESTQVEVKATNQKGLSVTNILKIQIRYNTPVADMTWDPLEPSVLDNFSVTAANADIDSRVVSISYKFDTVEIANNAVLDYTWSQDLGTVYQPQHTTSGDITWNDGFSELTIVHQETLDMTNNPPSFTLVQEIVGIEADNDVRFIPTDLTDPDGDDAELELKWLIEYQTPFDNTYKVVHNPGYPATPNLTLKEWIFEISGDYRITATAKDAFGLETAVESLVSFETGTSCSGSGSIRLNNNNWQLISLPVPGKNVNDYFLNKVEAILQTIKFPD